MIDLSPPTVIANKQELSIFNLYEITSPQYWKTFRSKSSEYMIQIYKMLNCIESAKRYFNIPVTRSVIHFTNLLQSRHCAHAAVECTFKRTQRGNDRFLFLTHFLSVLPRNFNFKRSINGKLMLQPFSFQSILYTLILCLPLYKIQYKMEKISYDEILNVCSIR